MHLFLFSVFFLGGGEFISRDKPGVATECRQCGH